MRLVAMMLVLLFVSAVTAGDPVDESRALPTQTLQWRLIRELPHDVSHFTQGLEIRDGKLLESVGLYGRSALFEKSIDSGEVLRFAQLPRNWFGEGVTVWRDRIIVLTWLQQVAQVFDLDLKPVARHRYTGEGWGLTHDDAMVVMSDGSATLRFRSPDDFAVMREIEVRDGSTRVTRLNELEFARGRIYANVWRSDRIAVIDPASGRVDAWIDLSPLRARLSQPPGWNELDHVLNGIAHDPDSDRFYVTGKCWPTLFEIEIAPVRPTGANVGIDDFRQAP